MVHSDLRAEAKDVRGKGKKTEVGEKRVVASWVLLVKECAWGYYPFTSGVRLLYRLVGMRWVVTCVLEARECVFLAWIMLASFVDILFA
ncbi:hypothetical protein WUBG_15435, partial [Wuchereria bancrofti]